MSSYHGGGGGAHLTKYELFLAKRNGKLPGITQLIQRATLPFLWLYVLGLNGKLQPHLDPLVQTSLQIENVYSVLLGCNEPAKTPHRSEEWIANVQGQGFALGVEVSTVR